MCVMCGSGEDERIAALSAKGEEGTQNMLLPVSVPSPTALPLKLL